MRKILAAVGTTALALGLALGTSGVASAHDDHSVSDDHSDYSRHGGHCDSERHSVNVANCGIHVIEIGNIL